MLPDIRLMIAAVLGSVVALICGFAVFAAFRVNHEPLAQLPSATAPLQLIVGSAAPRPLGIAAAGPAALSVIDAPIHRDGASAMTAPQREAAAVESPPAATAAPQQPAFVPGPRAGEAEPAPQAAEPPAAPALVAAVTADVEEGAAAAPPQESDPAPTGGASAPQPLSPQDQPQQASLPDEEHATRRDAGIDASAEVSAAADTAPVQALPVEKAKQDSESAHASSGGEPRRAAAHKTASQAGERKAARARVAARARRSYRPRLVAVANFDPQAGPGAPSQFASPPSSQFQTALPIGAPQTGGYVMRRVILTSRKTARRHSAVGGPYVRPGQP